MMKLRMRSIVGLNDSGVGYRDARDVLVSFSTCCVLQDPRSPDIIRSSASGVHEDAVMALAMFVPASLGRFVSRPLSECLAGTHLCLMHLKSWHHILRFDPIRLTSATLPWFVDG